VECLNSSKDLDPPRCRCRSPRRKARRDHLDLLVDPLELLLVLVRSVLEAVVHVEEMEDPEVVAEALVEEAVELLLVATSW